MELDKDISINKSSFICQDILKTHSPGIFYGESPINYSFTILMFELIFLVSITRIIRILLKPLRQPRVVSDLLGGLVMGPSVLGRSESFTKHIFPPNATYITRNIGVIGFAYYLFISGVKMDVNLARKAGKKQLTLAAFCFMVPFVFGLIVAFSTRKFMEKDLARPQIIGVATCVFAISSFPVIEQIIKELNLLSSEVGRLALATTIVTDVVSINCIVAFEAARHYDDHPLDTLWTLLSALVLAGVVLGFKHFFLWIVETTPEGKPVNEGYVVMILLGALMMSFCSDVTGINLAVGPHWLGLVIPTGPPLGATMVERLETILREVLMPFAFAFVGMTTDVSSLVGSWGVVWPLFAVAVVVCVTKFGTVFGVARFYEMPVKDSLALAFLMGMRGEVEFLLYLHWLALLVVPIPSYSMLVLFSTLVTAISTPMVSILYDPTRLYMVNKRRAIQYTAPNSELLMVVCIHDEESVAGFINLLEFSNPTANSPYTIFALRLIELVGRAHPVFVDHENQAEAFELAGYNRIHNALTAFQESIGECVKYHHFTSVSPTRTMYQDVCKLAMTKKVAMIILPFRTESMGGRTEVVHYGDLQSLNTSILSHAPCSVGILIDRASPFPNRRANQTSNLHFAVLFMGGPDSREALAYADRMASNPSVNISVTRFLSRNGHGDDPMEKKLDDGVVTWFWVKNEANGRVAYREAIVSDGSETVGAIQTMMSDCVYDLWIVGRKSSVNQVLTQGLSNWGSNDELGVIGDYIASVEMAMNSSVLVVQQQVLRGQEGGYSGGLLGISCCR